MQIFGGIGVSEILFILVLMVIVLGPQKMVEGARDLGKTIRKVTHSQFWKDVQQTSREIREIPQKIMDEADIEDDVNEIKRVLDGNINDPILNRSHQPEFKPPLQENGEKDDKSSKK
ncbi:MAG TPA: hypothetical protein DCK95_12685 [Anaerolineaceae bacterium]|nr:hypothetical protein [Anaerolineaceae bacterium]